MSPESPDISGELVSPLTPSGIEFLFFLAPLISGVVMFVTIYLAVWAALATHDRRKARRLRQPPYHP
ncbi:hypothetical protein [Planomonospora parontospora]|uniref:hypothetical protein n=1 Tax=Planomonospora parontospora TaxID=58119 RepID=UPI00167042BF|nr:hypothetical protein [Planomonospora parontospora]GGL34313.1 hypothetical protein GCM10014719_39450 [Planomonospora parontospora subsp. antibiotica]GII17062.1 hypothetical protein Ppa05_37880 [Planomonospora parontospora subsp. antibiotica]